LHFLCKIDSNWALIILFILGFNQIQTENIFIGL
jgi:hypothetical protein